MDDEPEDRRFWERTDKVPTAELWEAHQRQKLELAIFARGRLRSQFARHGEAPATLEELEEVLDPGILTIGFARRFATYKRAALLFTDLDRLARILWDTDRPVQIVFAGKAHPADRPGQGVIQDIFGRSRSAKLRGRVFILEDYDIRIARFLVQGVDVWLNNPRRPLEASGTSGMKAAANGVLNMSVLDGWWDEGWTGDNGWAIGGRETNPDEGAQDWADAQDLYRILEQELIPAYYERDADGLPDRAGRSSCATPSPAPSGASRRRACSTSTWSACTCRPRRPDAAQHDHQTQVATRARRCPQQSTEDGTVAPRISLALAIHNHQPVGNFGWVFAEVYDRAYLPMLEALERHPGVRLSLHYTGPLLEWLAAERPEFLARLGALVARDQVELLGGGLYEPILASLPEQDRVDQLTRMASDDRAASRAAGRRAPGSRSGSGSRTCRRRWRGRATAGRSSTTSTSAPPPSPRRTSGAPTRPRTRATCSPSSAPSRASATGSRSGPSRTSSATSATTRPRTASASA